MDVKKVFIADDEILIRTGLEIVINAEEDMEVVGTAMNGSEALEKIIELHPDIILMDVRMPEMDGIQCAKKVKEHFPEALILILTTYNEEEYIIEGLANGASGYLLKGIDFPKLIETIRDALNGHFFLPREVSLKLAKYLKATKVDKDERLSSILSNKDFTKKEREIIVYLANRLSNKEIAEKLFVSEGTIKNYLTIIYQKLNVSNRYEAIQYLEKL
ncbi:MAG: DNA-binding response regulator [Paenibacillus sp.]|jgi:DNA-binding NarL/FixJ family response regulator|nr:DNA-binding response regulator [Paenibacillus sp.]